MSALRQTIPTSVFQKSLVDGYFIIHKCPNIPSAIIEICILYCFILDEFDIDESNDTQIAGINNTIAIFPVDDSTAYLRNYIKTSSQYHWVFKLKNPEILCAHIHFVFIQNNNYDEPLSFYLGELLCNPSRNTFHLYFDTKNKICHMVTNTREHQEIRFENAFFHDDVDNIDNKYKLFVNCSMSANKPIIELIEYHDSNWYMKQLSNNNNPYAHIRYAECIYDITKKIKHYSIALKLNPFVTSWNNKYVNYLIKIRKYHKAYEYALKYRLKGAGISKLVRYYHRTKKYKFVYKLLEILDEPELKQHDLYFDVAHCCDKCGDKKKALMYYQLYLDQHENQKSNNEKLLDCIENMAVIYYQFADHAKFISLVIKLDQKEINKRLLNGMLGFCYENTKNLFKASYYYQLHIDQNAEDPFCYNQIYLLHQEIGDYENGKQYLLRALDVAETDESKCITYWNLGLYEAHQKNWNDAIKFSEKALEFEQEGTSDSALIRANLAEFWYKSGQYDTAYKYLSEAMRIDPDNDGIMGNYGIVLYHLNRFDEAIIYLEKCISSDQDFEDNEGIQDCLYIYGKLLHDTNQYEQSIAKCWQLMNHPDFKDYQDKKEVYDLLHKNYTKLSQCSTKKLIL